MYHLKKNIPDSTRMTNCFSKLKHTHLNSAFHDAAEKGDFESVKEALEKDPSFISKYDIDGKN